MYLTCVGRHSIVVIERELRYELKMERENIKTLSTSKPSSGSLGRHASVAHGDPKNSEVVRFYEDLTNLLVTNVKIERGRFLNLEECQMTCVYTHVDSGASPEYMDGKSEFPLG
jgi:hypothetical protein